MFLRNIVVSAMHWIGFSPSVLLRKPPPSSEGGKGDIVGELLAAPDYVGADAHIRPRGAEGSAPYNCFP